MNRPTYTYKLSSPLTSNSSATTTQTGSKQLDNHSLSIEAAGWPALDNEQTRAIKLSVFASTV